MGKRIEYRNEYDDPYKLLASYLVVTNGPLDVARMLRSDECIERKVIKELRSQDFRGPFLDCVVTEVYPNRERMEYMHALDHVGKYIFHKLDLERLRNDLRETCERLGIFLEEEEDEI